MKMQIDHRGAILLEQFEQATPLILARLLVIAADHKPDSTFAYNTNSQPDISPDKQIDVFSELRKQGLIEGKYSRNIPKEGGRDMSITVLRPLLLYHLAIENYTNLVQPMELAFGKQISAMREIIKEESARTGRNDIKILNDKIPQEINPFLAILWLEAQGLVAVTKLNPFVRIDGIPTPVLTMTLTDKLGVIATDRFLYELGNCRLTLRNGTSVTFDRGSLADNIIRAIHNSPIPLTDKQLVRAARSKSSKSAHTAASEFISDIRKRLQLQPGDANDIFTRGSGWGFLE